MNCSFIEGIIPLLFAAAPLEQVRISDWAVETNDKAGKP